jgi:pimeloyl-ACP methyl ester carboxylesterase
MIELHIVGAGRTAAPIVLIHAFPLSSAMYREAATILTDQISDRSVILVDLPGFGSAQRQAAWTMEGAMRRLHHELGTLGIRECIVGGTSMGGYAAFAYFRLYAEEISGLVFSNTKAEADDEKARAGREDYALDVERRGIEAVIDRQLNALVGETTKRARPERVDELRRSIEATDPHAVAAALRAMAVREDSRELLASVTCPTLVISSSEDTLIPPTVTKQIALSVERSRYEEISDAGHLSPFETPREWASLVAAFVRTLE